MRARTRRNAIAGLWDSPPWRDWAAWLVLWWVLALVILVVVPAPEDGTTVQYPWWVNLIGGFFLFGFLALLPPLIRRWLRQAWSARRERQERRLIEQPTEPRLPRPPLPLEETRAVPPVFTDPRIRRAAADPPETGLDRTRSVEDRTGPDLGPEPPPVPVMRHPPEETSPPVAPTIGRTLVVPSMPPELVVAERDYPYPIAAAARKLQGAGDLRAAYDAVLDLAETLTNCLGAVVAAVCLDRHASTVALQELLNAYLTRGVSQGHWRAVVQDGRTLTSDQLAVVPGLADGIRTRKGGTGLPETLTILVAERNKWAHGSRFPSQADLAERLETVLPALATALGQAAFLSGSDWIFVEDNRYQRDTSTFRIRAQRLMGSHPDFDVTGFDSPTPLADDVLYIRTPSASLALSPFIVLRECLTCRQPEVFHSDRLKGQYVVLKSFGKGHELHDPALVGELKTSTAGLLG